ncbi:hypothetical protein LAJ59_18545, partial [Streptococcus pneumoniae]|nr:hypothetical protein [Streptococcus pneumoniae]
MNKHVTRIKQKGLALLGSLKLTISKMNTKKKSGKNSKKKKQTQTPFDFWTLFAKILLGIKATFNTLFILAFIGGLLGTGVALG